MIERRSKLDPRKSA